MKRIGFLLALVLLLNVHAIADDDVTANDLARHLGISVWRIPKSELPKKVTISVRDVINGKMGTGGTSSFLLDGTSDLVVCGHEENGKMIITIACGGAVVRPIIDGADTSPYLAVESLRGPAIGNHLLVADYPVVKTAKYPMGNVTDTGRIQDVSRGLVLVVE